MSPKWQNWSVVISVAIAMLAPEGIAFKNNGNAQIRPVEDSTLGIESSVVIPNVLINGIPSDRIEGGARRGDNLFHSFQFFNIAPDRGVYFTDPGVQNIFSRVTGNSPSDIQGRLGVLGNANLFLVNPNGIVFGSNARLDVRGSFLATTASAITFLDGTQFIASPTQSTPVLTINVPIGLQFGAIAHDIQVQGAELAVPEGRTLALVGNGVTVAGGRLLAPDGRVELQGIATGSVRLTVNGNNLFLGSPNGNLANISLTNATEVNVLANGRGSMAIRGQNLTVMDGGRVTAGLNFDRGSPGDIGADIVIDIAEVVRVANDSEIANSVFPGARGNAGKVIVKADTLIAENLGRLVSVGWGNGSSGNVEVTARQVTFDRGSGIYTAMQPGVEAIDRVIKGGDATITADSVFIRNNSAVTTTTFGEANAGNVTINSRQIISLNGGQIFSSVETARENGIPVAAATGQGGTIQLSAPLITLRNSIASARTSGQGNGGDIIIDNTEILEVLSGSQVTAETTDLGEAGNLRVNTSQLIRVEGRNSTLKFDTSSNNPDAGDAGSLIITTPQLTVQNDGRVSARTSGAGNAGRILVVAPESVMVNGAGSGLFFDSSAVGDAQQFEAIKIETKQLIVQNGGQVTVNGFGEGDPGNLVIEANSIFLTNQGKLVAETKSGKGGSIEIQVRDLLLMRFNSLISASAEGRGDGGNVTINAPNGFVVAVLSENSDIVASAIQGTGGRAVGTAFGIYGFRQFRELRTPESDFTASSDIGFDGVLELNTQERDPLEGLPIVLTEPDVAEGCRALRAGAGESKFILTNRGGLPMNPTEALDSDAVEVDLVTRSAVSTSPSARVAIAPPPKPTPEPLIEAQGWIIDPNGTPVLIAHTPNPRPVQLGQPNSPCPEVGE
ncbi:MAG: filamentous hemagglutinin N-terminal domain-containing protein [Leptolyngbyaceae cyanobacterium bins.349]|nr:filamentous hemagglutinin N-terminal domain-containing protein [Leptolyngbyaceae cyanobacterium bins.349]